MADTTHEDDRWRELAELLGLPDAGAPAGKPAPPAPPESPAIKAYEEPRTLPVVSAPPEEEMPREDSGEPTIPMLRDEPAPAWEADFDDEEDDTPLDESLAQDETAPPVEAVAGQPAPPGEEEKPRRGRRRRRRGRRRGGEDRPEGEAPDRRPPAGEARPPRDRDGSSRDRQGQGRGPRREHEEPRRSGPPRQERPQPAPSDVDDLPVEQPARTNAVPSSDTDFSDWNVPSWQDLISALYRPDR